MKQDTRPAQSVSQYISQFPSKTQARLRAIRRILFQEVPGLEEGISYRMPAYRLGGILVYFAAFKNHIGFYPGSGCVAQHRHALVGFRFAKGSIQFPHDRPLPVDLIRQLVVYRAEELRKKEKDKKGSRKAP